MYELRQVELCVGKSPIKRKRDFLLAFAHILEMAKVEKEENKSDTLE